MIDVSIIFFFLIYFQVVAFAQASLQDQFSCFDAPTQLEIIHSVTLRSRGHSKMIAYPLDPLQGQCPLCAQWLLQKKRENNRFHQYG